jgi:hypothetical protein
MPICPNCNQEISRLFTDSELDLTWCKNKWVSDIIEQMVIVCPNCYEEMSMDDLDKLKVPLKLR